MKKIYILAFAALALTSCEKNDDNPISSEVPVKIKATIGGDYTTRAKDNVWSSDDKIGITATSGPALGSFVNMEYINGENGFSGNPIYFYNPMTLSAYYPFDGTEGSAPGKDGIIEANSRALNQAKNTQPFIDFLFAGDTEIEVKDGKPVINLSFRHKMSKLTFIFVKGNEGTDVKKIDSYTIDGLVLDGTFNTANGVCAVKDEGTPESLSIDLTDVEVVSGEPLPSLIVFPQTTADKTVTLKITDSDGQAYSCDLKFDNFGSDGIKEGYNYQFTIKVSKAALNIEHSIIDWSTEEGEEHEAKSED